MAEQLPFKTKLSRCHLASLGLAKGHTIAAFMIICSFISNGLECLKICLNI